MSDFMLSGTYYDGERVAGTRRTLIAKGACITLVGESGSESCERGQLLVSPRTTAPFRFVTLPGGGQMLCADTQLLDTLPQEVPSEGFVARLERRWAAALAGVAAIATLLICLYLYVLPVAAQRVAERISPDTEAAMGGDLLGWLDAHQWVSPSRLPGDLRQRLLTRFADLVEGLPQAQRYTLVFRASARFGPNALAFPGGIVLLTDQMVGMAQSEDEVVAVLAHEIGHVEKRHAIRTLLHNSVLAAVAAGLTSDAGAVSTAVAGAPALVTQLKYSRDFETEADAFAFALLRRHGVSPGAFADIMARIAQDDTAQAQAMTFLSSHPHTEERVAKAREAASAGLESKTGEP